MKLLCVLAISALLSGAVVQADTGSNGFATSITQSYAAAGYADVSVTKTDGTWYVTGNLNGVTQSFTVHQHTGV